MRPCMQRLHRQQADGHLKLTNFKFKGECQLFIDVKPILKAMPDFSLLLVTLLSSSIITPSFSFIYPLWHTQGHNVLPNKRLSQRFHLNLDESSWNGEVVSNSPNGKIQGCLIEKVDDSLCEWTISIDGVEADLGKFSEAIYRKITSDAKKMRFQGFRPGTIPPHLIPTYIAYTMDECAREATLEAMAQNNIRAFEDARNNFKFERISIAPVTKKKSKQARVRSNDVESKSPILEHEEWSQFQTMKEAIDAGWKPGSSFSFTATNVKGQLLKDQNVVGSRAIGAGGSSLDLNQIKQI